MKDRAPELEDPDLRTAVCCHGPIPSHALTACEA
jgi:hypothetical protein